MNAAFAEEWPDEETPTDVWEDGTLVYCRDCKQYMDYCLCTWGDTSDLVEEEGNV